MGMADTIILQDENRSFQPRKNYRFRYVFKGPRGYQPSCTLAFALSLFRIKLYGLLTNHIIRVPCGESVRFSDNISLQKQANDGNKRLLRLENTGLVSRIHIARRERRGVNDN